MRHTLLFWTKLPRNFTIKSFLADSRTIKFPHYKSIFFNEISNSFLSIFYLLKPFVLLNMTLYYVNLSIQNLLYALTSCEHILSMASKTMRPSFFTCFV